jgi:hypothetical protein
MLIFVVILGLAFLAAAVTALNVALLQVLSQLCERMAATSAKRTSHRARTAQPELRARQARSKPAPSAANDPRSRRHPTMRRC